MRAGTVDNEQSIPRIGNQFRLDHLSVWQANGSWNMSAAVEYRAAYVEKNEVWLFRHGVVYIRAIGLQRQASLEVRGSVRAVRGWSFRNRAWHGQFPLFGAAETYCCQGAGTGQLRESQSALRFCHDETLGCCGGV